MYRRLWQVCLLVISVAVFLAGCGQDVDEGSDTIRMRMAHEQLTPGVREIIRTSMARNIGPTYVTMWQLTNRGDLEHVPELAGRLLSLSKDIVATIEQEADSSAPLAAQYGHMAAQAESIVTAARENRLVDVVEVTRRLKRDTCDGCHKEYQAIQ